MKIKNNRRAKYQFIGTMLGFIGIVAFMWIMNTFFSIKPDKSASFYIILALLIIIPATMYFLVFLFTSKTIVIEENGVAQYDRKGKLKKLFQFNEICNIIVSKSSIHICIPHKQDYPFQDMLNLYKLLIKKNRKRYGEHIISFANNKRGFKQIELSFINEIKNRCGIEIIFKKSEIGWQPKDD